MLEPGSPGGPLNDGPVNERLQTFNQVDLNIRYPRFPQSGFVVHYEFVHEPFKFIEDSYRFGVNRAGVDGTINIKNPLATPVVVGESPRVQLKTVVLQSDS